MSSVAAITGILPILDAGYMARQGLYLPGEGCHCLPSTTQPRVEQIAHTLGVLGFTSVQLRCKGSKKEAYHFCQLWMQVLRASHPGLVVIINDHVDLAVALDADGVHVGQDDMPVKVCRQILRADKVVGLSTHNMEEVLAASQKQEKAGHSPTPDASCPDYIGFGPVFVTNSKTDIQPVQGVAKLENVCAVAEVPVVAIGGIHQAQLKTVASTGASAAAMISELWHQEQWPQRLVQAQQQWQATRL